jgi:hypothetical protein
MSILIDTLFPISTTPPTPKRWEPPPQTEFEKLSREFFNAGQHLNETPGRGYTAIFGSSFGLSTTVRTLSAAQHLTKFFAPFAARTKASPEDGYRVTFRDGALEIEVKSLEEARQLLTAFMEGLPPT